MNFNDKIASCIFKCEKLDELKTQKIKEFSETIEGDITDLLNKKTVNRQELEEYLINLRDLLKEKEEQITSYIDSEKNALKFKIQEEIREEIKQKTTANEVSLTDKVMENALDFVEAKLAAFSAQPDSDDPIAERLSKVMPAALYTASANEQKETSVPIEESNPVVEESASKDSDIADEDIEKSLDELESMFTEEPESPTAEPEFPTAEPTPVVPEVKTKEQKEAVSTVELEQMLEEFEGLLN